VTKKRKEIEDQMRGNPKLNEILEGLYHTTGKHKGFGGDVSQGVAPKKTKDSMDIEEKKLVETTTTKKFQKDHIQTLQKKEF